MESGTRIRTEAAPLADASALTMAMWVIGFALATTLAAQVRIPLPGTPVPITLQTLVVLAAGVALGPGWAAVSIGLYVAAGALGAPVFTQGGYGWSHLTGATAGYIVALPVAAYLVGWIHGSGASRLRTYIACISGELFILGVGTVWLALLFQQGLGAAAAIGALPFLAGDLVKTIGAAEAGRLLGRRT